VKAKFKNKTGHTIRVPKVDCFTTTFLVTDPALLPPNDILPPTYRPRTAIGIGTKEDPVDIISMDSGEERTVVCNLAEMFHEDVLAPFSPHTGPKTFTVRAIYSNYIQDPTLPADPEHLDLELVAVQSGAFSVQVEGFPLTSEICDGKDNDLDFAIDEGFVVGNTHCGTKVEVISGDVAVTYDIVDDSGDTLFSTSGTGPALPAGFKLGTPPTYYEVSLDSNVSFLPLIEVCIKYDPAQYGLEDNLRVLHWNGASWDVLSGPLDTDANVACGESSTLSPFVVAEQLVSKALPTAIGLASFEVVSGEGQVLIKWTTGTEIDNEGFNILRATSPHGPFSKVNGIMIPARGISPSGASYGFVDRTVENGVAYYYQLEDIDTRGIKTAHHIVSALPMFAKAVSLPDEEIAQKADLSASLSASPSEEPVQAVEVDRLFFFQVLEGSGNTLEVTRLETEREITHSKQAEPASLDLKVFSAEGRITLVWTASDPGARFNILRSEEEDGEYLQINGEILSAPEDAGEETVRYTYSDTMMMAGITTYYYKLEQIGAEGESYVVGPLPATARQISSGVAPQPARGQGKQGQSKEQHSTLKNTVDTTIGN
jgi:hypothetical protein